MNSNFSLFTNEVFLNYIHTFINFFFLIVKMFIHLLLDLIYFDLWFIFVDKNTKKRKLHNSIAKRFLWEKHHTITWAWNIKQKQGNIF